MSSNRKFYYFAVFLTAMIWYILWAFLVEERYSGEWAAYILAIYVSGFLEVGIEKFFYVQTYESENTIRKGYTCVFAVVFPTWIAEVICEVAFLTGAYHRYIASFCIIAAGTAAYRLIYWFIEIIIDKIQGRR